MYGAIKEQMDILAENNVEYDVTPGVSAAFGAAASLKAEYTLHYLVFYLNYFAICFFSYNFTSINCF